MGCFGDLPYELRLQIWVLTIPEDEEEVCLCWPGDLPGYTALLGPLNDIPVLPLTVDTGFPVAMHICRESRAIAQNTRLSGTRFRPSHVARCMTPFRRFRPELDVLYLDQDSVWHLNLFTAPDETRYVGAQPREKKRFEDFMDVLRGVKRLAVAADLMLNNDVLYTVYMFLWEHIETPEHFSVVIPSSSPLAAKHMHGMGSFTPPGRRCRLVACPLTENGGALMPYPRQRNEVVPACEVAAKVRQELRRMSDDEGPEQQMLERQMLEHMGVHLRVFTEYQRDGSWQEVCANRMYHQTVYSFSRRFVPLERRPNPELVRVHDADVEFAPDLRNLLQTLDMT